jgi:hypothetical protein
VTITIHRKRWTYVLRLEPRSSVAALRLAAELSEKHPSLVVRYCGANASGGFVEIEDLADRTRTVEEFAEIVRLCAAGSGWFPGATVRVAAAPTAGRGVPIAKEQGQ